MALYTPFFERAAATAGNAYGQRRTGELARNAYLGDQNAIGELALINPALAGQIKQQKMQEEQANLSTQATKQSMQMADQEWALKNREILQQVAQRMAQAPTFDVAQQIAADEISSLKEAGVQVPERFSPQAFTPEAFAQLKQQFPSAEPAGFTLAKDAVRYDAQGKVIASNLVPEGAPNERERELRIKEYMDNFDLTRQEAISRLDAQYMTDPVTGNLIAVDRATGGASIPPVATGDRPAPIPAPPPVDLSELSFDPGKGTGAGASFLGLWNSTLGQLPFIPTIMGPETAAQQLTILERDAIKALASSSRPPVVEQERILQAIPKAMEWGENPNVARSKMVSFIDLMTNQYVDDLRYAKDLSQPKELREASSERARSIEGIINRTLTPEAATAMLDSIKGVESDLQQINAIPFDQLETIQLDNLSDAALDAYIERLKSGR